MNSVLSKKTHTNTVLKNTFVLNVRVLLVAGLNLLTTRIVLKKLGVEDFGIFSIVAGFTGTMAFLSAALSSSTQRHIAYSLGANKKDEAKKWFNIGLFLHVIFAMLVLIASQTVGMYLFKNIIVIPDSKLNIAYWLYQM
jgi:O-antigen/teichoic acid export membrane protein